MTLPSIAVASAKSFGDFVIAHSTLRRIEDCAKDRTRLIAFSHLAALNAILPAGADVTLIDSGEIGVPAVFDVKKCGALAAVRSAFSLRKILAKVERRKDEVLAFDTVGPRERFIAGDWRVAGPRVTCENIYDTYRRLLADHDIRVLPALPPVQASENRTVGIFPESRLTEKHLSAAVLSLILRQIDRARLDARVFVLDGDLITTLKDPRVVNIPRNFATLATAINSVGWVISADSLPAHLGEYFARPVFVASGAPNEYWLPHGCFTHRQWAIFHQEPSFIAALDRFLAESAAMPSQCRPLTGHSRTALTMRCAASSEDQ